MDPAKVKSVCLTFNVTPRVADALIKDASRYRMSMGGYLRMRLTRGKKNEELLKLTE